MSTPLKSSYQKHIFLRIVIVRNRHDYLSPSYDHEEALRFKKVGDPSATVYQYILGWFIISPVELSWLDPSYPAAQVHGQDGLLPLLQEEDDHEGEGV